MPQDLRFALRLLRRSPGFAVVAILTLALGIGANTAVFSIIHGALLRPLPYRDPSRLVDVLDQNGRDRRLSKLFDSYSDYREWQAHAGGFEGLAFATWAVPRQPVLSGQGATRGVMSILVSDSFFSVLGVAPTLGRTFRPEDAKGGCAAVLSHAFWSSAFNSDPGVLNRGITLDHKPCTVAGIMPATFAFYPPVAQMWLVMTPDTAPHPERIPVFVVGRLKPGVTPEQAQAELGALHAALHQSDGTERDLSPVVDALQDEFTWLASRNLRATLWALLAAVGLVLLIACVNVANLLLGRAIGRSRELAIRAAVGGSRRRVARQLLTEGLLLAVLGGCLGTLAADAAVRWFAWSNPVEMPAASQFGLSLSVLLFTLAVSVATSLLFGLAPAWKLSRANLNDALKSGGRGNISGGGRLAKLLVAAEVAVSVLLLAGAGLVMESVLKMGSAPLGYVPQGLYTASIALPETQYPDAPRRARFYDDLQRRLETLPGVERVCLSSALPPYGIGLHTFETEDRPLAAEARPRVGEQSIGLGYFETMGSPMRSGRGFDARDRAGSEPVAIVDEALARQYFPDTDPIGRRVRLADDDKAPWLTIVGVAANEKHSNLFQEMSWTDSPTVFRPLAQDAGAAVSIAIRSRRGTAALASALQRELAAVDPDVALGEVIAMPDTLARILAYPRFRAIVLSAFGGLALLLAAVGLHGVLAQMVARRSGEIGVRVALGARPSDILRLVVAEGGIPVISGLAMGIAAALAAGRLLGTFLYNTRSSDPLTLGGVALTLLITAAVSISLPARRAAAIDPLEALRRG